MVVQSTRAHDKRDREIPGRSDAPQGQKGVILMDSSRRWSAGAIITSALVIIGLVVLSLWGLAAVSSNTKANADATPPDISKEAMAAIIDTLTVDTTSADAKCVTDDYGLVTYRIGALEAVPAPRLWSDGLSTPIVATDAEGARDELQRAICEDPLLGVSYLTFMATDVRDALKASTGVDIVELNPWLKPYAVDPKEINTIAVGFIPLMDVAKTDVTVEMASGAMDKNREWQKEASYVNTLLDRFAVTGIEARESLVNYHLAIGGLVVGNLSAVERNGKQEGLPALIFSLTEKDQCENLLAIGANTGDKRPELFGVKSCEVPVTPGTTETPGTLGTPATPVKPVKPTPTPTPTPNPCPPGNEIPSCAPKSSNPDDYVVPKGKPVVAPVTAPPEVTPPVVVIVQPGGGGVVDTPTNNHGSETGVTAPDATPAPTTPTPVPSNEGGTNGTGDTGGF